MTTATLEAPSDPVDAVAGAIANVVQIDDLAEAVRRGLREECTVFVVYDDQDHILDLAYSPPDPLRFVETIVATMPAGSDYAVWCGHEVVDGRVCVVFCGTANTN
jgi:hypothetical protein